MNPARQGPFRVILMAACGLWVLQPPMSVHATSTGLNNIPTADTPSDRTVVFQLFGNFRDERPNDFVTGFKLGAEPFTGHRLEFGVDGRFAEGHSSPAALQFKYALALADELPALGLGVANLALTSNGRARTGHPFTFAVVTHDFGAFRAHAGYGFQRDNDTPFFGFDMTTQVFERDLMLRSDFIQIDDRDQWLGSAGFIYFIDEHLAIESWVSQPFEHGEPTFTLKLNLAFTF